MSRAIFFNVPKYGHINSSLDFIKCLIEKGEEIIYYATEEFEQIILSTGAIYKKCELLDEFNEKDDKNVGLNNVVRSRRISIDDYILAYQTAIDDYIKMGEKFCSYIDQENPNYIIYDNTAYWGKYIAKKYNLKSIYLITTLALNRNSFKHYLNYVNSEDIRTVDDKHNTNVNDIEKVLNLYSNYIQKKYGIDNEFRVRPIYCVNLLNGV